jgi:hypothetical protein
MMFGLYSLGGVEATEVSKYNSKCSLCIMNGHKYCNGVCQTLDANCNVTAGVSTYLDACKDDYAKSNACNKLYIITSRDFDTDTNVEA